MSTSLLLVDQVHSTIQAHHTIAAERISAAGNPFDNITPDFTVFGAKFTAWWQKLLAAVWGIAIIICAFKLFPAALAMHSARKHGNPMTLSESTQDLQFWGIGTGVVLGAAIIFGAVALAFS